MYLVASLLSCFLAVSLAKDVIVANKGGQVIWVGTQTNDNKPALEGGGFKLGPGEERTVPTAEDWAGRFWGRTGCNDDNNRCVTGDCGDKLECNGAGGAPPASLAEFKFKGSDGQDFYDISFVDGFNLQIAIIPTNPVTTNDKYRCAVASCKRDLNQDCPNDLKLDNGNGQTVGCKSACAAFNTDEYCCRNDHDKPETCKISDWGQDYPKFFKDRCPDGYSWAYDDQKSTFTCENTDYRVEFY